MKRLPFGIFARWMVSVWIIAIFSIFSVAGCVNGNGDDDDEASSGLVRCANCNELENWIEAVAIYRMQKELEANQGGEGYYDDDDSGAWDGDDDDLAGDDDDDYSPPSNGGESGDDDDDSSQHSDTNVQEQGVDEADILKTDGERLLILSGGYFMIFDPHVNAAVHELSRTDILGRPLEMFLYGDMVLIFSYCSPLELPATVWPNVSRSELNYLVLKITLLDITDSSAPVLVREAYTEGEYISSRRIDASARVVIYSEPIGPEIETWINWDEYCDWNTGECDWDAIAAAYEQLEQENQQRILDADLEDWLPQYFEIVYQDGEPNYAERMMVECENTYHPASPRGYGLLTIMTVMLDDPMSKQPDIGLVADIGMVYGSSESIYIADTEDNIWDWENIGESGIPGMVSNIHKFDIHSNPQQAIYKASGQVNGFPINQFALSEYQGYLRIATNSGFWGEELTNAVYVLEEAEGNLLQVVGSVEGIAVGEEMYAARFMGPKGYLVTFEQTDPLFTLDMADPYNPILVGELEVPGFSTYIHSLDEDHLLTIGVTGDEFNSTGGVALSIFDVSDFANPVRSHYFSIGDNWSASSEAQYNHKAFLYYEPMELLVIPVMKWADYYGDDDDDDDTTWPDDDDDDDDAVPSDDDDDSVPPSEVFDFNIDPESDFSGFLVFNCAPSYGFTELFVADHSNFTGEPNSSYTPYMPWALRSAVIGNYLYTLSDLGLLVSDLETQQDVLSIEMPYEDPYYSDGEEEGVPDGDDW